MTVERGSPVVLRPGEGQSIDLGNFGMTLKASGDDTGRLFTLLEATEPADFGPPMHIHTNCGEAFYVLDGEYVMFIEERQYACPAGSFIFIPQGTVHGFRVGPAPSKKLNFYLPAAMVDYFEALSSAISAGQADETALNQIAIKAGVQVVGPVPEGYL